MKKKIALTLTLALFLCLFPTSFVSASSVESYDDNTVSFIEYFEDGSYVVTELSESTNGDVALLSSRKTGTKTSTYYSSSGTALCALKMAATFTYDGTTAYCVSTNCYKYSYDSSWSVEDVTTSHSAASTTKASATANGKFIKRFLGIKTNTITTTFSIYCDKNGTLS